MTFLPVSRRHAGVVEGLDVLLGEHLEDELVAQAAGRVAGAGLGRAEDGEGDAGGVQQLGDRLGGLLGPVFEGAGAADPEQVLDAVGDHAVDDRDLEVELGDPVGPAVLGHAPRVALALEVVEHRGRLGRERGLDQDLVAAHAVDVVDVLDVDRALLDAGAAVRARPQDVRVDDAVLLLGADQGAPGLGEDAGREGGAVLLAGEEVGRLGERVVAQVEDELLGRQRLAGRPGRALRLAAAALGAGAQVEQALPAEVLDLAEAEHVGVRVGLLEVEHLAVAAHGLERPEGVGTAGEHDVERREADVQVLGVGDDDQEGQHDAELEQDEGGLEDAVDAVAEGVQRLGDDPGGERPARAGTGTRRCSSARPGRSAASR